MPTFRLMLYASISSIGLITFRLQSEFHRGSFASNLKQVVKLLCAQVNLASYPQHGGK